MDPVDMLATHSAATRPDAQDAGGVLAYPSFFSDLAHPSLVDDTESPAPPGDTVRRALRRIAAGITVLTVGASGPRHGTTVSATVQISVNPLVLGVCLRASSAFTAMAKRERFFSVNVLDAGQALVAAHFAAPGRRPGDSQFAVLPWATDALTGAPLIEGCLAHLSCEVADCRRIGDHDLIIAKVIGGMPRSGVPLLSFAGRLAGDAFAVSTSKRE